MPRLPRFDGPDSWFHIMNRGLARRPVFENRADMRYFLACLARAVRRGEIEVHAFCVMINHFHLLVRSPTGRISEALRRIQNEYVRRFNRIRDRDGPLFRGRFRSRPARSRRYRRILVRYLDHNPVAARTVELPSAYPWGSAWHYARRRRPPWLTTSWIDGAVEDLRADDPSATYETVWGRRLTEDERALVLARIRKPASPEDDLDDLIGAAPEKLREWMSQRAQLADRRRLGVPMAGSRTVMSVVGGAVARSSAWLHREPRGRPVDLWPIAQSALLQSLCALTHAEIAARLGVTAALVGRRIRAHRKLLSVPEYGDRVAALAAKCLDVAHAQTESGPLRY